VRPLNGKGRLLKTEAGYINTVPEKDLNATFRMVQIVAVEI